LVPFWLQLFVSAERVLTSWFGEPRILWSILTCSRARPQPVVWMAPACERFLCATAVLSGHVLSPGSTSPGRRAEFCAQPSWTPGTSSALGSASPGALAVLCGRVLQPSPSAAAQLSLCADAK